MSVPRSSRRRRPRARHGASGNVTDSDDEGVQRHAASDDSDSDLDSQPDDSSLDSENDQPDEITPSKSPLFPSQQSTNWSDNVSNDLPVLDFADMKSPSSKPIDTYPQDNSSGQAPLASSSRTNSAKTRRPVGQTARQAYQTRLEKDPAFVPTVGQFWGHDDRLLDKDLRSLSTWWRGKWQNRARGFDNPRMHPNPRGGRRGTPYSHPNPDSPQQFSEPNWGHDGFEEMKVKEDVRSRPPRGTGFPASRGRRGGYPFSPRGRGAMPFSPARFRPPIPADRPWFTMKPEHPWTKQHEAFLFHDHTSRWNPGQVCTIRIKLGDKPARSSQVIVPQARAKQNVHPAVLENEEGAVVRLPMSHPTCASTQQSDSMTLVSPPSFPDSPHSPAPPPIDSEPSPPPISPPIIPAQEAALHQQGMQVNPYGFIHPTSDIPESIQTAILQPQPLSIPTAHSPLNPYQPPMSASPYDSPYGYSAPLPPGIAINHLGMPFEMATGRPVYLQTPVYDPNAGMTMPPPSGPSGPSHARHYSSVGPDFVNYVAPAGQPQPPPPPPSQTNAPADPTFFSYPKQSSRIDIKRPDGSEVQKRTHMRGLSVAAPAFEPINSQSSTGSPSTPQLQEQYPPPMMRYEPDYSAYPPSYFYPEARAPYSYGTYPAEMYPQEQYSQGATYYQQ